MTAPTETVELPKLPSAVEFSEHGQAPLFSSLQLTEFARAAVLADRASRSPVMGAVGGEPEWMPGGKEHVLATYSKLHEKKLGMHWLWAAVERVAWAGETPERALSDFGYVPESASPTAAGPMTARMLTDKETMDAYCVPWPEGSPFPKWMARMDAVIRKFCEVNGIGVSPTGSPEGEVSNG